MSKANEQWPKRGWAEGTPVTTTSETKTPPEQWTELARQARRWNASGKIIDFSDAHGLCYQVIHDDGSTAYYDPAEILVKT